VGTGSLAVPAGATARRRDGQEERVREQPVVVALGGNAISPPGSRSPIPAQYGRTLETAHHLVHLTERPLVVTHGNGPQVGNVLLRSDLAAHLLPRPPLDACVADTQGGMGFMLQQCLDNAFCQAGVRRPTVAVVTRTVVEFDDLAFRRPSKPIGSFYEEAEARRRMAADGWVMEEDAGRGWRRVVPSPEPREIVEERAIRALLDTGAVVIAAGGGGVPVVRQADGSLVGVEAVVDKDLASALLAGNLGAEVLLILTGVEHVALDFGRPTRRDLHEVTAAELAGHADAGQFAAGSMLPKVRAAIRFLALGGRRAVITTPELSEKALAGEIGTQVVS
jgi:carbamate kinase